MARAEVGVWIRQRRHANVEQRLDLARGVGEPRAPRLAVREGILDGAEERGLAQHADVGLAHDPDAEPFDGSRVRHLHPSAAVEEDGGLQQRFEDVHDHRGIPARRVRSVPRRARR